MPPYAGRCACGVFFPFSVGMYLFDAELTILSHRRAGTKLTPQHWYRPVGIAVQCFVGLICSSLARTANESAADFDGLLPRTVLFLNTFPDCDFLNQGIDRSGERIAGIFAGLVSDVNGAACVTDQLLCKISLNKTVEFNTFSLDHPRMLNFRHESDLIWPLQLKVAE